MAYYYRCLQNAGKLKWDDTKTKDPMVIFVKEVVLRDSLEKEFKAAEKLETCLPVAGVRYANKQPKSAMGCIYISCGRYVIKLKEPDSKPKEKATKGLLDAPGKICSV
jgi:hypothetical protein